jgi:hypothetical protein
LAQKVPSPAPDIENALWRRRQRQGQIRSAVGYLPVQPPAPATFVATGACVERSDVAIIGHGRILSAAAA